jgi:TolB protein
MLRAGLAAVAILVGALAGCGDTESERVARIVFATSRDHVGPLTEPATINTEVYSMTVDGQDLRRLTDSSGLDLYPRVSPNGEEIACHSNRDTGTDTTDLFVMPAAGGDPRQLTRGGGVVSHEWSPDGELLVYTVDDEGPATIRVVRRDGSGDRELVEGSWPSWSPEGDRILYTVGEFLEEPQSLAIVAVEGGLPEPVSLGLDNASESAWSPSGDRIAFMHNPAGYSGDSSTWDEEIYVATIDGTGLERVSNRPGNDHWPPAWSSDGRCLTWQGDHVDPGTLSTEIYAAAVDVDEPEVMEVTTTNAVELFPAWAPGRCSL